LRFHGCKLMKADQREVLLHLLSLESK